MMVIPTSAVPLGAFLPIDSLFSTQGIMVMLLAAYALAMWMFLTSAPKVHTIMVTDLEIARQFYEGLLNLPIADVPLHYYYNYEQTIGSPGLDPLYYSTNPAAATAPRYSQPALGCRSAHAAKSRTSACANLRPMYAPPFSLRWM